LTKTVNKKNSIDKKILRQNIMDDRASKMKSDLVFYMVLIALVVIAIVFRCFFVSSYTVSGTSMYPTLNDGDWVWVNKLVKPQRGDIVVAYDEYDDKALVKRVIAIEGDLISLVWSDEGYVVVIETVDGQIIYEEYDGVTLPAIRPDRTGVLSSTPYLVTEGYFLMGDNRNDSNDSRNPEIQCFEKEKIIGVVMNDEG